MPIKVELSGKLKPEDVNEIVKAHIEKVTKKKVHRIYGVAKIKYDDTPYGNDHGSPVFDGIEFDFEPEEIGG
jgi:hypothetical protein